MRHGELETGELDAVKVARPVRGKAVGKGRRRDTTWCVQVGQSLD